MFFRPYTRQSGLSAHGRPASIPTFCVFSAPRGHEADVRTIIIKVCNYFLSPSRQINRKISAQKAIKATNKRIARKESKGSIKFSIRKYKLFFFFRITGSFPSVNKGRGQRIFRGSTCILHQNFWVLICLIDAVCRRRQECDSSPPRGGGGELPTSRCEVDSKHINIRDKLFSHIEAIIDHPRIAKKKNTPAKSEKTRRLLLDENKIPIFVALKQ